MEVVAEVYDALRAAQGVTDGEVAQDQARAAAAAVVSERVRAELAGKADLRELRAELAADLSQLEAKLSRLIITTLIATTAIYAGIVAMLKFL